MGPEPSRLERFGRRLEPRVEASRNLGRDFGSILGGVSRLASFRGRSSSSCSKSSARSQALAVAERATRNIVEGKPATEGLGEAYGQSVVGGLTPQSP
jgi:hypothetical protein